MVKGYKEPTRKRHKLEDPSAYLTPWYLVSNNCNTNKKRGAAGISNKSGGGAQVSATGENQGRGSTGVEFF